MLIINDLDKKYNSRIVLKNCNYVFPNIGMFFITGKSGCGKTTLLNLIAGFDKPTLGDIIYNGVKINKLNDKDLNTYWSNDISFIFQSLNLIESLNVEENLLVPLELIGIKKTKKEIDDVLKLLGLANFNKRRINQLSGGQKQRVAIARALLKDAKILLCDEPTGALDKSNSKNIFDYLKEISKHKLVIIVSHNIELAKEYADHIIDISDGTLLERDQFKFELDKIKQNNDFTNEKKQNKISFCKTFKMSLNYLFKKKITLIFSLLFVSASFLSFSLSSTFAFKNKIQTISMSMIENDENFVTLCKQVNYSINVNNSIDVISAFYNLSKENFSEVDRYYNDGAIEIYDYFCGALPNCGFPVDNYYLNDVSGFAEINNDLLDLYDFKLHGSLPTVDDEIAITEYMFNTYKETGFLSDDYGLIEVSNYDDLFGENIAFSSGALLKKDYSFKIVGIIDTDFNYDLYPMNIEEKYEDKIDDYYHMMQFSLHNALFLNEGFYKRNLATFNEQLINADIEIQCDDNDLLEIDVDGLSKYDIKNEATVIYNDEVANGILLSLSSFFVDEHFCLEQYLILYCIDIFPLIEDEFVKDYFIGATYNDYFKYLVGNGYQDDKYYPNSKENLTKICVKYFIDDAKLFSNNDLALKINSMFEYDCQIAGIYYGNYSLPNYIYLTNNYLDSIFDDFSFLQDDIKFAAVPLYKNNYKNIELLTDLSKLHEADFDNDLFGNPIKSFSIIINNDYSNSYDKVDKNVSFLYLTILIVGFVSLVFAIFFLIIYIQGVINDKKQEIGIFKSLGTNKKDLLKIFLYLNVLFFVFVSFLLTVGIFATTFIINNYLFEMSFSIIKNYLNINWLQYIFIYLLPISFGLLTTFIPINKILNTPILKILKKDL